MTGKWIQYVSSRFKVQGKTRTLNTIPREILLVRSKLLPKLSPRNQSHGTSCRAVSTNSSSKCCLRRCFANHTPPIKRPVKMLPMTNLRSAPPSSHIWIELCVSSRSDNSTSNKQRTSEKHFGARVIAGRASSTHPVKL